MKIIISLTAGVIAGALSYKLGTILMPGCGKNDIECRRKHLRHGFGTGISVAVLTFIIF